MSALLGAALAGLALTLSASAQTPAASNSGSAGTVVSLAAPRVSKFKAVDADNKTVILNRPGLITLILGTNADSQDAARQAGRVMYPFQGRPDFQLMVVVDLRDSIATWVPSVVLARMRSSLDGEAVDLKPYFLKNGNTSNPRDSSHVIADFSGTICPQLGWTESCDDLRAVLFGADGREIERWDKVEDMDKMRNDIRTAISALMDANRVKAAALAKTQGTKLIQPPTPAPPLPPDNSATIADPPQ